MGLAWHLSHVSVLLQTSMALVELAFGSNTGVPSLHLPRSKPRVALP
jgi:hypothetical protein